jgi:hypothetical protein
MKEEIFQNVPDAYDLRGPTFRSRFGHNFCPLASKWMDHTLGLSPLGSLRGLRYSRGTAQSTSPSSADDDFERAPGTDRLVAGLGNLSVTARWGCMGLG